MRAKSGSGFGNTTAPVKPVYDRPGLSTEEIDELREAFNLFDMDGSGEIDPQELKQAMQSLGYDVKNQMVYQVGKKTDEN
jgi:Ca2+-binding EF-hand superfamily protein